MKKLTNALKEKAIETAAKYDTTQRPAKFQHYGKTYAVSNNSGKYTIYDDADGGNSIHFSPIFTFEA